MEAQSLKAKTINGVFWNVLQLIVNRLFAFVIKLVLVRLLLPEQFGLVGMATVVTTFVVVLNDLGIGAALVQRKEEQLREAHFHTAFWTGVVWSIIVFLLITFAVAPIASAFYKEPLLAVIIPVLCVGVLLGPVNLIHRAKLTKQMSFKKLALIDNISTIFSGSIALILAFMGAGVWALVFNSVATFIIATPLLFRATSYVPKFCWEKKAFDDVFGFGVYTTGTNIFNNLVVNLDYLLIGKLLSASALGVYTLAFVLTDTFRNQLTMTTNRVMFPVYSKKQDDPISLKRFYLKLVKYNSILIYPIMMLFIVLGKPIVLNVFGQKWGDAIIPLKILALSVMLHMLVSSHAILIRGTGRAKLEMRIQFLKAVLYAPTIWYGIHLYGIKGAAGAYLINKLLEVVIAQYFLKKLVNISPFELLSTMKVPLIASSIAMLLTYLLYQSGGHYIICALVLVACYAGIIWLLMQGELKSQLRAFGIMRKLTAA